MFFTFFRDCLLFVVPGFTFFMSDKICLTLRKASATSLMWKPWKRDKWQQEMFSRAHASWQNAIAHRTGSVQPLPHPPLLRPWWQWWAGRLKVNTSLTVCVQHWSSGWKRKVPSLQHTKQKKNKGLAAPMARTVPIFPKKHMFAQWRPFWPFDENWKRLHRFSAELFWIADAQGTDIKKP